MTPLSCIECHDYHGTVWAIAHGQRSVCAPCMLRLIGGLLQQGADELNVPVACVRLEAATLAESTAARKAAAFKAAATGFAGAPGRAAARNRKNRVAGGAD